MPLLLCIEKKPSAFSQARALDSAQKSSESYLPVGVPLPAAAAVGPPLVANNEVIAEDEITSTSPAIVSGPKCYFCGYSKHPRVRCPARSAVLY